MQTALWTLLSVTLISFIALVGLAAFALSKEKIKTILPHLISFAAGALFGDAFIHLLPTAFAITADHLFISIAVLSSIVILFVVEKLLYWHRCYHLGHCAHRHTHGITCLIGDSLHNFTDGILIAGSYLVSIPLGLATTLAVALHEIPQEIADFGILLHAGFSIKKALWFNFISALFAFAGALLVLSISTAVVGLTQILIPFTAGSFIYIAGTNLLPALQHEKEIQKIALQVLFLLLGIGVMLMLYAIE